jgi:hypothetical protein
MRTLCDVIDDLALVAFVLVILLLAQGCGAARAAKAQAAVKAPVAEQFKDIEPDCDTAGADDVAEDGTAAPCALRSTTKI